MRFFGGDVANVSRLKSPPSVKLIGQGDVAMNTRLLIAESIFTSIINGLSAQAGGWVNAG